MYSRLHWHDKQIFTSLFSNVALDDQNSGSIYLHKKKQCFFCPFFCPVYYSRCSDGLQKDLTSWIFNCSTLNWTDEFQRIAKKCALKTYQRCCFHWIILKYHRNTHVMYNRLTDSSVRPSDQYRLFFAQQLFYSIKTTWLVGICYWLTW